MCVFAGAVTVLASILPAQSAGPGIGVVGGVNLAQLSGGGVLGAENRVDLMLGLSLDMPRSASFSFQPELIYTRKGQSISLAFSDAEGDFDLDLDLILSYIELPLLARFSFPQGNARVVPHLLVGPAVALKVGCTVKADIRVSTEEGSFDETFKGDCEESDPEQSGVSDVEDFDFGLVFGGGLTFGNFSLGVRYDLGLQNVNSGFDPTDQKNRVLSFAVRYALSGTR
jgi:hypothetical protein